MPHLPPIVVANGFLVTLEWNRYLGVMPRNVLGFHSTGDKVHVGTVVGGAVTTAMFQDMEAGHVLTGVSALPLDGTSASYLFNVAGVQGGQSVNHIQPAVTAIVSLKTALRGPRNRGRVYVGPVSTNSVLDGVIPAGIVNTMRTAWATFFAACTAASPSVDLAVVSRKFQTLQLVGAVNVEATAATQRRRQTQLR